MIYANTASVGILTEKTRFEVSCFVNSYEKYDFYINSYKLASEKKEQCKEIISSFFKNKSSCVLLYPSTTDALCILLSQLNLKDESVIALPQSCFPSIDAVKISFEGKNYKIIEVGNQYGEVTLKELKEYHVDCILMEWVNYWSGFKNNIKEISEWCQENQVILAVDAVQGVGCCEIDFDIHKIDFFISGGHKWLRALEGCAFAIVSERMNSLLKQSIFGYNSFSDKNNFDKKDREIEKDLYRFEIGTLSTVSFVSLYHSLSELSGEEYLKTVCKIKQNSTELTNTLVSYGACIHSPIEEEKRAGIISFTFPNVDSSAIYNRLLEFGVIAKVRNECVRLSPDISVDINELIKRLSLCLKGFL